jgi:hypothetical protein
LLFECGRCTSHQSDAIGFPYIFPSTIAHA